MNATHKAKKVETERLNEQRWLYRGGWFEKHPSCCGRRRGNWYWGVCGVTGWVNNKAEAKQKIDSLLAAAQAILQAEKEQSST